MQKNKGIEPSNQNLFSQVDTSSWSPGERQTITAFFALLLEIDQEPNLMKVYQDAETSE